MKKTTTPAGHEVIPSPKRMMKSLRDVGYEFPSAVADIVDNSIEAGATRVDINVVFSGDDSWLTISDNGCGMNKSQLIEAMRYGSERNYTEEDLGKFGFGLKTASLSQCRFLAVASRDRSRQSKITAFSWDLNHIERTNKWEILPLKDKQWTSIIYEPLKKHPGTVVLWRQLDRVLGYKYPYGEFAKTRLITMCRDLERHLAMVFHRFLSGSVPKREKIEITLNSNPIKPWDPFARKEDKTHALTPIKFAVEHEGVKGQVLIEPYILPHQQEFSSMEEFRLAGGPENWNQQQGFYIYRAGRLIQSGGWSRLRTPDEHTKLARIAISFSPQLDEAFKINVAKMRVQLPSAYRESFEQAIQPVVKLARERYDRKEQKAAKQLGAAQHSTSTETPLTSAQTSEIHSQSPEILPKDRQQFWTLDELEEKAMGVANTLEKHMLRSVFKRLRKKLGAE